MRKHRWKVGGGALTLGVALFAVAATGRPPAMPADPVARWQPLVRQAAGRFGLPDDWIIRVIRAESGGRTSLGGRPIRSRAGAIGLMQLMPVTWMAMRQAHGLGIDPDDPKNNILAGTAYLRAMYDRFGYPGLFAAYNAGPARYAAYRTARRTLPAETQAYLAKLTVPDAPADSAPSRPALFAVRHDRPVSLPSASVTQAASDRLFAVESGAR